MRTETDIKAGERTQHTPGPWATGAFDDKVGHRIVAPYGEVGNFIAAHRSEGRSPASNGFADARLIAAAPELLAALKLIGENFAMTNDHPEQWDGYKAAITAIAKAEGRAQ